MKTTSAASHRQPTIGSLEQRIANQERRINQGVKAGTLTQDEAKGLRDRLHQAQQGFEKDGFENVSADKLGEQQKLLNGLSKDIKSAKHNDAIDPQKRIDNIDQRIEKGLKDGSLTPEEAEGLKKTAADLRSQLGSATTDEQKKALTSKLQDLSKQVHSERHDGEMDIQKRMTSFQDRIKAGMADGSLTQDEAKKLTEKLSGLQGADAKAVNQMSRSIFHNRHDRDVDTTAMGSALSSSLDALGGKEGVDAAQVDALKQQLATLTQGGTAVGERMNILREQIRSLSI